MTAIADHLAGGLDIRLEQQVSRIAVVEGAWSITTDAGRQLTAGRRGDAASVVVEHGFEDVEGVDRCSQEAVEGQGVAKVEGHARSATLEAVSGHREG